MNEFETILFAAGYGYSTISKSRILNCKFSFSTQQHTLMHGLKIAVYSCTFYQNSEIFYLSGFDVCIEYFLSNCFWTYPNARLSNYTRWDVYHQTTSHFVPPARSYHVRYETYRATWHVIVKNKYVCDRIFQCSCICYLLLVLHSHLVCLLTWKENYVLGSILSSFKNSPKSIAQEIVVT